MIKRIPILALCLVLGTFGGAKIGQLASYWLAPDIMRLYLAPQDYWQRLPALMVRDDPLGLTQTVMRCSFAGSLLGALIILTLYYYLNRHRKNQ